jgi:quercetin dioxygenase-like cupin family protein
MSTRREPDRDSDADAHQRGQERFRVIRAEEVPWEPFAAFPPGAQLAVLVGDPTKPGPYVIRVKLAADTRMLPHRHPEDRIYTVISGVFYIGLGKAFDASLLSAHGPGSVIVLPANQPHFHWAKSGEYVTQVSALGPLGLHYLDPADDPRLDARLIGLSRP